MNFLNFMTSGMSLCNLWLQDNQQELKKETLNQPIKIPSQLKKSDIATQGNIQKEGQVDGDQNPALVENQMSEANQKLINQYLQLNIQYLSKQVEFHEKNKPSKKLQEDEEEVKKLNKKIKKINNCGHPDKNHYAKGMCNNCYHKYGRTKKPWNCRHDKLYAAGMCQNCYINNYNKKRREQKAPSDENNEENLEQLKDD